MLEPQQEYISFNFTFLRTFLSSPKWWIIVAILSAWIVSAYAIFDASYIQYSPDSFLYKALSQQPLTLNFLIQGDRSPTLPVLLKLFKSEHAFVWFQLGFFYLSWLTLFLFLRTVIKNYFAYVALLCVLAALSIAQIFFSWHKLILTESVSLSGAVLLLALLCRILAAETVSRATVGYTLVAWILWQFTRDSNAFFSLMIAAGFLVVCSLGLLAERKSKKWKKGQILAFAMCLFASFQLFSINSSERWKFPLVNVIGLRILPDAALTSEFVAMGMPMNEKVLCFRGKNAVDCNKDWSGFGQWLKSGEAKADYQYWLLKHFVNSVEALFLNWEKIWTSDTILYGRSLQSPISVYATKIALPKGEDFLHFTATSLAAAALALSVALRSGLRHWLSGLLLFYAVNIPIAFIAFHGDALDVDRHTLNVQLNTYLTGWILILWAISFILEYIFAAFSAAGRNIGSGLKR